MGQFPRTTTLPGRLLMRRPSGISLMGQLPRTILGLSVSWEARCAQQATGIFWHPHGRRSEVGFELSLASVSRLSFRRPVVGVALADLGLHMLRKSWLVVGVLGGALKISRAQAKMIHSCLYSSASSAGILLLLLLQYKEQPLNITLAREIELSRAEPSGAERSRAEQRWGTGRLPQLVPSSMLHQP